MSSFIDKIRSGAGKAAFEADKLRRINAHQSKIKTLQSELEQALLHLGNVTYTLYENDQVTRPALQDAWQRAKALEEQISAEEQKVEEIRQEEYVEETVVPQYGRTCPNGHGPIPPENNYCQECGAQAVEVQPLSLGDRFCQQCGQPLSSEAKFCANCGTPAPEPEPEPEPRFCQECGTRLLPDAVFCSECGTPVEMESDESAEPTSTDTEPPLASDIEEPTSIETRMGSDQAVFDSTDEPPEEAAETAVPESETEETELSLPDALDAPVIETAEELSLSLEQTSGEDSAEDSTIPVTEEASTADEGCPVCGNERLPEAVFCAECGHPFATGDDGTVADVSADAMASSQADACPECGSPLLPDALFCAECGHQLEGN